MRSACTRADAADDALTGALGRLPRRDAPERLRRKLYSRWDPRERRWARRTVPWIATVGAAAAIVITAVTLVRAPAHPNPVETEAINDYLRVVYSEHPVEIESGGIHQVKPWFEGRVDFAPVVSFAGDQDFPLRGGSVAYFLDRKAAALVYGHGAHVITLFVFRADGLPWPHADATIDGHRVYAHTSRGFNLIAWRDADLGYALVSDASGPTLQELARRIESENDKQAR